MNRISIYHEYAKILSIMNPFGAQYYIEVHDPWISFPLMYIDKMNLDF